MAIAVFFICHWFGSLFFQTFFLHRYAAHRMFSMSQFWERVFFVLTYIAQGSSFLNPRAYAIMHRLHHAYSDTPKDPHSPHYFRSVLSMMVKTKHFYQNLINGKPEEKKFTQNIPAWPQFERFANLWIPRLFWGIGYTTFYVFFATSSWMYLLLPLHYLMGPIHGAIVNWCGHKYGYVNYKDTHDHSRNTLPFDFLTLGELFQNNHHRFPSRSNFATKSFEVDPTYPIVRLLHWLGIIDLNKTVHKKNPIVAQNLIQKEVFQEDA